MPTEKLTFFRGMGSFGKGMGLVAGTPSLWGWSLVPMGVATVTLGGLGALSLWGGAALSESFVHPDGTWSTVGYWALKVSLWAVGILLSGVLGTALAQPLSGPALDRIVHKVREGLGAPPCEEIPFAVALARSLKVTLFALAVTIPAISCLVLIEMVFPPAAIVCVPLKFVVTAHAFAWDLLDYPLSARGLSVRGRIDWFMSHWAGIFGFGGAAALLFLIPCFGLFLLPMGVAGATVLVERVFSSSSLAPQHPRQR